MRRAVAAFTSIAVIYLLVAPTALGADGVGLWGRADDKVVTYWGLAVVAFFPILITVLSLVQHRLDKRKEERKRHLARAGRA